MEVSKRLIKFLKFKDESGKVSEVKGNYGQTWESLNVKNDVLNSIFKAVDSNHNSDGKIQAEDLNMLNKISLYIDKSLNSSNKDGVLDKEELQEFSEKLEDGTLDLKQIIQLESEDGQKPWSEGLERNISKINVSKNMNEYKVLRELKKIGEEQGFEVQEIESGGDPWIEDSQVRRHDGKSYLPYQILDSNIERKGFVSSRGNVSNNKHGRVIVQGNAFDIDVENEKRHYGSSYLEGGNVLNTIRKDGTAGAIVGEGSIGLTLDLMKLEHTPENIKKVKEMISKDLNLELDKITFIPQHEFHVDVTYHHMKNGVIAVPDYKEGAKILNSLLPEIKAEIELQKQEIEKAGLSRELEKMTRSELQRLNRVSKARASKYGPIAKLYKLEDKLAKIEKKATELTQYMKNTQALRGEANDYLMRAGYNIVKIPHFAARTDERTNYLNGVGGTSQKTGQTFFITNKSEFPELDEIIQKYIQTAGVDKVYFVSTTDKLEHHGGIDCLTIEG